MNLTIFGLALLSGIINATWNFFGKKKVADGTIIIGGACFANVSIIPISLIILYHTGLDIRVIPFLIASGLGEAMDYLLIIKAYSTSDISMAYPVSRGTGVMLTALFSTIILKEFISGIALGGILLILFGIFCFALNKGISAHQIWESTKAQKWALIKGLSIVICTMVDKSGAKYANPLLYFNIKEIIALSVAAPVIFHGYKNILRGVINTMKNDVKYAMIIGYGIIASYVLILVIYNLFAEAKASYVTPIRECSVVFGAILGFVFLKERVSLNKIAGILALVLGVIFIKVG